MIKPTVHYKEVSEVVIGESACVFPVDHPGVSNKNYVMTSRVVAYDPETERFETENTLYVLLRKETCDGS